MKIVSGGYKRVLVKGTFSKLGLEPFNEWLASEVCKRMGFKHCPYTIGMYKNRIVSKCDNFLTPNQEIITAFDIFYSEAKPEGMNDFDFFVGLLEKHGIKDARKRITDMFFVDYITGNTDRHMGNFGIIRDVRTLQWLDVTPIFDTGESMCTDANTPEEIDFETQTCKFFTITKMPLSELPIHIDFSDYDLCLLNGLAIDFRNKLHEYSKYIFLRTDIIERLCSAFAKHIDDTFYKEQYGDFQY